MTLELVLEVIVMRMYLEVMYAEVEGRQPPESRVRIL
jgi:hypothetical protein